jgi:hypothetical protein
MVDHTTNLDDHRGMKARAAAELRRMRAEVEADQALLRQRRQELEKLLFAEPAAGWADAVEKARYLITLFAESPAAEDPRRRKLIKDVLDDFDRLLGPAPDS